MKKRMIWLTSLMAISLLAAAVIYILGRLGWIPEAVMMLVLLPLMLGVICLTCLIYAEETSNEKRDR